MDSLARAAKVLAWVRWTLRFRRFILSSAGAALGALSLAYAGRNLGRAISTELYLVFPLLPFFSVLWPLSLDRRLFWVGRRLGLGGKLAGISAAKKSEKDAFLTPLLVDLRLPLKRLFLPEIFALFPSLLLGVLLILTPMPTPLAPHPGQIPPLERMEETEARTESVQALEEEEHQVIPEFPVLPPGFAGSPPYPQIFATLFGEEVSLEEAVQRLSQEEGLLRRLSELLQEAQITDLTAQKSAEIGEILEGLTRPDVRQALSQALAEGGEGLAQAEEAVAAALEGLAYLREEAQSRGEEGPAPARGEVGEELAYENPEFWGEILPDVLLSPAPRKDLEELEAGPGLGIGEEEGQKITAEAPQSSAPEVQMVSGEVRSGEGPVRTGIQFALPGETPAGADAPASLTPQQVELLLREGTLPPELRELVRRYFELLAGGGM